METPEQTYQRLAAEYDLLLESLALNRVLLNYITEHAWGLDEAQRLACRTLYAQIGNLDVMLPPAA